MTTISKRPKVTKATRSAVLAAGDGRCYICGEPITDDQWDADHEIARELGGSDGVENLRPAHKLCHRTKTKADIKLIAKGRRIRRSNGPIEDRRKPKKPLRGRPFQQGHRTMQSRGWK